VGEGTRTGGDSRGVDVIECECRGDGSGDGRRGWDGGGGRVVDIIGM
jgi:hypothetical protein